MKTKDIAAQYGIDKSDLEKYIKSTNVPNQSGLGGMSIDDGNVSLLVANYKQYLADEAEKAVVAEKAAADKQSALARMLITSGFNFDGYTITRYSGYISGDDAISVERRKQGIFFPGAAINVADALMESLVVIRRNAMAELKEAAYALGCNAVIGVDFDYITLEPETSNGQGTTYHPYVFGVTANGNAVIIEKNKRIGEE